MKFFLALLLTVYCLLPTVVSAQSIDLLWEGESYAPPFYQGGVPWSKQGYISLVAVPSGLGASQSLNYKWTKNGTVLGSLSGVGKNTLRILDSVLSKPQEFKVEIISSDDAVLAQSAFTVRPQEPELVVYENNPLYGVLFHRALSGEFSLTGGEATLTAFPYWFNTDSKDAPSLEYVWRSNAREDGRGSSITYRRPEGVSGSTAVSVRVSDPEILMMPVTSGFLIQFGE